MIIIDDSEIDLLIQKRFLELYGFKGAIELYTSVNEAFINMSKPGYDPADIIFLDLNMPESDGFTFLNSFNQLPYPVTSKTRIVVLTSSENPLDKELVMTYNPVIEYLTKPLKQADAEFIISKLP